MSYYANQTGLTFPNPDDVDDVVAFAAMRARKAVVARTGLRGAGPAPVASVACEEAARCVKEGIFPSSCSVAYLAAAIVEVLMLDPVTLAHLHSQRMATPPGFLGYGRPQRRTGGVAW
jgi:hypothetical protein